MLSIVLWVAPILAGFVAAQDTSKLVVPAFVDLSRKVQWCTAEQIACPLLCGGNQFTEKKRCIGTEIPKYECICSNGTAPANIEDYIGSVPNSICIATFEQCRRDNPGSEKCVKCGLLDAKDVPKAVVSSTIATPTATATDAADTAAAATASATGTNGADASAGNAAGVGGLAMGVMAALGLLL